MTTRAEPADRALVVVPVLGHHEMTHALLTDLHREAGLVDIVIVDNGGDYPPLASETVIRPGTNLGWAGGTNLGTLEGLRPEHLGVVWLNNDTRLSRHFVAGLRRALTETNAGIVAPFYDCFWRHQQLRHAVSVDRYRPRRVHYQAPFVDGTCMLVAASTLEAVGVLDAETFGPVGWGADVDYCLRVRQANLGIVVTRLSYLHHEKSVTGITVYDGIEGYTTEGYPVLERGLEAKWGADWRTSAAIDPSTAQTRPPSRKARR